MWYKRIGNKQKYASLFFKTNIIGIKDHRYNAFIRKLKENKKYGLITNEWRVESIDKIPIKTPNPKCRHEPALVNF